MEYTLMHKNIEVMGLDIDVARGRIKTILSVYCQERVPLSVQYHSPRVDTLSALNEWLQNRSMPKTRDDFPSLLRFSSRALAALSLGSMGLNLSDQYWFRPAKNGCAWEEVNFFTNSFPVNSINSEGRKTGSVDLPIEQLSPDYSTNGNLPKFWYVEDGKRWLAKAGSLPYNQEQVNEMIASKILEKVGLFHVPYFTKEMGAGLYSVCHDFVKPDTEYIPAYEIWNVVPYDKHNNSYNHFLFCVNQLGIPNVKRCLDTILQFDYLINNEDRHLGNFGFLRDVNTLEFIGMAPIFDNGNSLWFDKSIGEISVFKQPVCPFSTKQERQLKLTEHSVPWIHKISEDELADILLSELHKVERLSEKRIDRIVNVVLTKRNHLLDYDAGGIPY